MVHCSMMPVASGPGAPAPRPKLGFSIDSLVGEGAAAAPRSSDPAPAPSSPEPPRRRERSPPAARRAEQTQTLELQQAHQQQVAQHQELLDTDMLQQRLAHERALHERLLAHGLGAAAGPLAAFGGPLAPLARLPLADPRYMKLAQLRGELALQGRAGGGGVPSGLHSLLAGPHPHPPTGAHPHPAAPSEMPLYPWLMSRHGRVFPGRYAPGPHLPEFLFQPFRKPKRIRTAFSPTQLLKLEHAFEKNHYVVGQERKQLAQTLSLSETQVKVWFQNRRTKHKRSSDGTDGGEGGEGGEGADGADGDAAEGADAGEGSEGGAVSEEGGRSADPGAESDSDSEDNAGVGIDVTN